MKSIISFILLIVNFFFYQQSSLADPSQQYFQPPKPLKEVVEEIPEGYGIVRMTTVSEDHRSADVAFTKPHTDIEELLKKYKEASDETLKVLLQLFQVRSGHESEQYLEAKKKEEVKLKEILNSQPTDDLLIQKVIYGKL